jgi:Ser/Thr protein kinase RdoA (MazF antagonist)
MVHRPEDIILNFPVPGALATIEKFGSGLINDTYLCTFRDGEEIRKYVLQRINASVFKSPGDVMENVEVVTQHIAARLRAEGVADPYTVTPALIHARSGRSHHVDGSGSCWRVFHFIEDGTVFDQVKDVHHAYEIGRGLGRFQSLVADLAPSRLHDTLPGFHHTPRYLEAYDDVVTRDAGGRAAGAGQEREFVSRRRKLAPMLTELMDSGRLPLRVVHNDPKVNNVMVHRVTGEALCMLDLDTVKPGIVHFDFGDCVRSVTNPAGEDGDLDRVTFDLPLFRSVTRGYLSEASSFLTKKEIEMLPASVKVITFELGIRFLADYLRGDTYFRINHPSHNLLRARVQFKLLESIEAADLQSVL